MPHVIVKMFKGRTEEMKQNMAEEITKAIVKSLNVNESSVSVAVEEFDPDEWNEAVYKPDIIDKEHTLYRKPGYKPQ
ncbi:MAG TPA: tautomerase family protein [Clostridiales bacterium]|nr:tautomerase family protein [Clostridiales bacterium]